MLRIGEAPYFGSPKVFGASVTVGGQILAANGTAAAPGIAFTAHTITGLYRADNQILFTINGALRAAVSGVGSFWAIVMGPNGAFAFAPDDANGIPDLYLHRDAANVLAQRNGVNAQAFRLFNTYTDASNNERMLVQWSSNTAYVLTEGIGSGAQRDLQLGTVGAAWVHLTTNSTRRWSVNDTGHLLAFTDNAYDIGAAGATRPRAIYAAGLVNSLLGTATAAGGAKALGLGASGPHIYVGSGAPTITAVQGSCYFRTDGSSTITRMYINTDGGTIWTPVTTVG